MRMIMAVVLTSAVLTSGCGPEGAPNAQRELLRQHIPRLKEVIALDRSRHRDGVIEAAHRLRRGFLVEDVETRERQMRQVMTQLQEPPRGVGAFIASPMSFLAAIDREGIVIARDSDDDQMKGEDFGERFEVVANALQNGAVGMGLGEFPALEEGEPSSYSILFVAPARHEGEIVGAVVAGIPLWREAQRLSRQLRVELATDIEQGLIVWAYIYKGDRLFYSPEAPPEVTEVLPDAAARRAGLDRSPGGFTGEVRLHTKWYGFAVVPIPTLGEDVGLVVARADIPE